MMRKLSEHSPLPGGDPLCGKTVAVLGFGRQGSAHALNLRDSGARVIVASRGGTPSAGLALSEGFDVVSIEEAVERGDLLVMSMPDEVQAEVFRSRIGPSLKPGAILGFLHGFAIRFGLIDPPASVGVVLVAPKGPGTALRERYVRGAGLPSLFAVARETPAGDARRTALGWAEAIGSARAAIIETTFADETETDLFGEQAVLCGGLGALVVAAFETLVEAGYPADIAYMECCQEVKQIADLVHDRGLAGMMEAISTTAEFGAHRAGPRLIDDRVRGRLRDLLREIQGGSFAQAVRLDHEQGSPWLERARAASREHAIEEAGRTVRGWMGNPEPGASAR